MLASVLVFSARVYVLRVYVLIFSPAVRRSGRAGAGGSTRLDPRGGVVANTFALSVGDEVNTSALTENPTHGASQGGDAAGVMLEMGVAAALT